ncbi:hypothetical protein INT43_008522 [Umbelopsis isabellina]|uniref:Maintenance of telomere capping protein 1 n=1 Tax=Mortierella isabellina TaxID=91625 RepID=A0A8H7PV93_MORIS|nr:hypothetical protein INT43_008522 [Umbelopsis isabellina]
MSNQEDLPNSSLTEAEQFLKSLDLPNDEAEEGEAVTAAESGNAQTANASDIMSFLDEIANTTNDYEAKEPTVSQNEENAASDSWIKWGTSFWNQANEAVKTTTDHLSQVAQNPETTAQLQNHVKGWQAFISGDNVTKLGQSLRTLTTETLTTILDNVAPPISEHEVVQIWISHDIAGYVGLEPLVFQAFSKMMEQTDGGDVVIRKGRSTGQRAGEYGAWDMNFCDDITQATKLCKANIEYLNKTHTRSPEIQTAYDPASGAHPIKICPIYLAIQAVQHSTVFNVPHLQFVVLLSDPKHQLNFESYSQNIPMSWLQIPEQDNFWVQQKLEDCLEMCVSTIAQDYVQTRMHEAIQAINSAAAQQKVAQ